jgi:hypothetical protein
MVGRAGSHRDPALEGLAARCQKRGLDEKLATVAAKSPPITDPAAACGDAAYPGWSRTSGPMQTTQPACRTW